MATVNFSIPDEIKEEFLRVFAHENRSAVIARLMQQAVEDRRRQQSRKAAIDALLELRQGQAPVSDQEIPRAPMRVVIDASVIVKWVFSDAPDEPHVAQAIAVLAAIREDRVSPLQPPHWLAEVAAVVTRLRPEAADFAIQLLDAMDFPVAGDLEIYRRASRLSRQLNHHVFDTLYHAVALEHQIPLLSADDTYIRKAAHLGGIVPLADGLEALLGA
jgi:predicted nucleic acid-binding protein